MEATIDFSSNKKLLGAKGIATRSKKLLGAPGLATKSKDATRNGLFWTITNEFASKGPSCHGVSAIVPMVLWEP